VGTVTDIFARYNFANGTWSGKNYWEIKDNPGDGRFYYIVSAVEWSGLESRQRSNIYAITISSGNGTGSQDTSYPGDPGCLSCTKFYSSYNSADSSLLRYYNIYALDGSTNGYTTTKDLQYSKDYCSAGKCSWVDWLGDTNGSTRYVVTAVDTQGNESRLSG
jgi:hypothetical protein